MSGLEGLGFEFEEEMSGYLGIGETDCVEGRTKGEVAGTAIKFNVTAKIDDLATFLNLSGHSSRLEGTVTFEPLGGTFPIQDGRLNILVIDPKSGIRQLVYSFRFVAGGQTYFLLGHKDIKDDPGIDLIKDFTTLFTTVYEGEDESGAIYGAGQLYFELVDAWDFFSSMKVTGKKVSFFDELAGKVAFASFVLGVVKQEYLRHFNPFYNTSYENLILSGTADPGGGAGLEFFFVSGDHDTDFPWGDGEEFSDVLLAVGDGSGGYKKYLITDRSLKDLEIDVSEGTYSYRGPIYELKEGYTSASWTQMRRKDPRLVECEADFRITFLAKPYATTPLPFMTANTALAQIATDAKRLLDTYLPETSLLGVFITPHTVTVQEGSLKITSPTESVSLRLAPQATFGEAESTTLKNIKEPTMLYSYICAVRPAAKATRVQIHADSLRNERTYWGKDQVDKIVGSLVSHVGSKEYSMEGGRISVKDLDPKEPPAGEKPAPFIKIGEPILQANNNQFPTAVFERRIIRVLDPSGEECLAMEEAMDTMRCDALKSGRKTIVASIKGTGKDKDQEKLRLLEEVLRKTGFWTLLNNRFKEEQEKSGKSKADYRIVIKPNFMFAYNKADKTTFTDVALVEHLVKLLRDENEPDRGFTNITIVEAQSTLGEYFDNRGVRDVAEYIGYSVDRSKGYSVVDLTEDEHVDEHFGPELGEHPVPVTWKNADFRISFAKNKTHSFAYYTLTLKNIYGALPLANKFKEYHCDRNIYGTTMEYLQRYPVAFGLIDAYESADGPFGIFADPEPNQTYTILGGPDLVAVDWVGATKMGLDPMISDYMRLGVKTFGKPEIDLRGDRDLYWPWLNVPTLMTWFAEDVLDKHHFFSNMLFMVGAYADPEQFHTKADSDLVKAAQKALLPFKKAIFLQSGGRQSLANKILGRIFTWLGE